MTKQLLADDGFPKDPLPLIETSKIIESNVKIISSAHSLGIGGSSAEPLNRIASKPSLIKPKENRIKTNTLKCRLEKVMHKLYDLEPTCVPEKQLNVDLGVDLYQMEDY